MLKLFRSVAPQGCLKRSLQALVFVSACGLAGTTSAIADEATRGGNLVLALASIPESPAGALVAGADVGRRTAAAAGDGANVSKQVADGAVIDEPVLRDPPIKMPVSTWALSLLGAGFLWLVIRRRNSVALGATGGQ